MELEPLLLNTLKMMVGHSKRKYQIYVVALDDSILKRKDFRERNPKHKPGKQCLYVGQTAKDPNDRLKQHLEGGKFSTSTHL